MKKHHREIRQRWDAAMTYWRLAEEIRDAMPDEHRQVKMRLTSADIAQYYDVAIPTDKTERDLNILGAHLNSAAIRLATIDERFEEEGHDRVYESYIPLGKKTEAPLHLLTSRFNEFVHQLLRDNAAHIEKASGNGKALYEARQTVLDGKKLEELFDALQAVIKKFESKLLDYGVIAAVP